MLLKQLELHGLKSFADKTALDLSSSITAIVGPNGSGKSNITDAIRWLLGERDARNLRGVKGEDLIFAGTENRPRMGLAQATLYFDNSSGFFPVDMSEVSISRRIGRDGISQFFINKSEVRLKDLIDFLARAKLGARGLTIITQGESDVFIKANPTERREMIEEILGLKEYQLKKSDAMRKLEATSVNLDKLNAMQDELRPHVRLLRRQSTRYENREKIAAELADLENSFYGSRLVRLRNERERLMKAEKEVEERLKKEEGAFRKLEAEAGRVNESQPEAAERLKEIQKNREETAARRAELGRELGRIEARLEFQSKESVREGADLEAALKEIRSVATSAMSGDSEVLRRGLQKIAAIVEKVFQPDSRSKDSELDRRYKKMTEEMRSLEEKLAEIAKEEARHQQAIEEFSKTFRGAYEKLEAERKKLDALRAEKNRVALERERTEVKLSSLKEELGQIGRDIASLERALEKKDTSGTVLVDEDTAMRQMYKLRQKLAKIGEIDEGILREAKETEERYAFLESQIADLEKATGDLKALVKKLDEKIYGEFNDAIRAINDEFHSLVREMFGGGKAKLVMRRMNTNENGEEQPKNRTDDLGVDIELVLPGKRLKGLEALSGGERSLVSIAALFALISVSPPPFLVLDEIDAALDEKNARRFGSILGEFSKKTQFVVVTHNRATMEAAQVLYGCTMTNDGVSKLVSLKLA